MNTAATDERFAYEGPDDWRAPITAALKAVVDPEVAMDVVEIGLVYAVRVVPPEVHVTMTMTSAACPVTDVVLGEAQAELEATVPPDWRVQVDLVWEPAWTPQRMSARARAVMGW